jgi:hypothetical protein
MAYDLVPKRKPFGGMRGPQDELWATLRAFRSAEALEYRRAKGAM